MTCLPQGPPGQACKGGGQENMGRNHTIVIIVSLFYNDLKSKL